jgi:glutamate--cysteine ligase catalytic subunit
LTFSFAGLLKVGVPKTWDESKKNLGYIRNAGVRQFISTYDRDKDIKGDELLWGDEIEYGIFHIDPETKKVRLSLRAKEVSIKISLKEYFQSFFQIFSAFLCFLFLL